MKEKVQRYKSLEQFKKPNNSTKLPKIQSIKNLDKPVQQDNYQSLTQSLGKRRNINKSEIKNKSSFLGKLQPIQGKLASQPTNQQKVSLKYAKTNTDPNNKKSLLDIRQSLKIKIGQNEQTQKVQAVQIKQIKQDGQKNLGTTNFAQDSRSDISSRQPINPIINKITNFLSEQTKKQIVHTKMYEKRVIGQLDPLWWCVVDTLLVSLQKLIKVKKIVDTKDNAEKEKQRRKINMKKQKKIDLQQKLKKNPQDGQQEQVKEIKQTKKIKIVKGKSYTNVRPAIQMTKVYCFIQSELVSNQKIILKFYEDISHIFLVLQAFYYEKVCLYLIASLKKWNHPQEQFQIFNFVAQNLPILIQIRKLFIQIMSQAVQNQIDQKIKKPKYIAKEKKLIQISKYTTILKNQLDVCYLGLGSPHRYKMFYYGNGFRDHNALSQLQCKWKKVIFHVPIAPYVNISPVQKKKYLLVLQPLNILYKYNRKQQFLLIDPLASYFLQEMGRYFQIVFFTHVEKQSSLLNFMGVLDKGQVLQILDKNYLTYKQAKIVKDITKIGGGYDKSKILVLDQKCNHKYYVDCEQSLFLIDASRNHIKVGRIKGKLVRVQQDDNQYLRNLARKIITVAEKDGKWSDLNFADSKNNDSKNRNLKHSDSINNDQKYSD